MTDGQSDAPADLTDALTLHDSDSTVRNLCLVWPDGRRTFFNYAYLVSADLILCDRLNILRLSFSGQIVTLKGYHLGLLFDQIMNHAPKIITVCHARYDTICQHVTAYIMEISIANI